MHSGLRRPTFRIFSNDFLMVRRNFSNDFFSKMWFVEEKGPKCNGYFDKNISQIVAQREEEEIDIYDKFMEQAAEAALEAEYEQ